MHRFEVPDMTCGHCAEMVTKAIHSVDRAASVDVDIDSHEVRVRSDAEAAALTATLLEAGYPAQQKAA